MATETKDQMEIDFGSDINGVGGEEPKTEEVKDEPKTDAAPATKEEPKAESKSAFDEEKFAASLAKHLGKGKEEAKEPVKNDEPEIDLIDEMEKADGLDFAKHGKPLIAAMNERHKQTMGAMEVIAKRLVESEKMVQRLMERDGAARLKEEAGDAGVVEELKSASAKAASEILGLPETYAPKNDEEGRTWVAVANKQYAKMLAAKKADKTTAAPEKKASSAPVSKTAAPAKAGSTKLEQAIANIGEIDFG